MARRILEGTRVLDLSRIVAGPFCTRMLADMGADVIRVDQPSPDSDAGTPARSAGSPTNNVGKRSIVLDLKHEEGLRIARELAERSDVLVENFRPGVMDDLGLGYDALAKGNPRLVFASISGFGQSGGQSHRRAYGATAHAEAGWLWVQQQAQGGEVPFAPGITVADIITGTNAFAGIVAALLDRERTGNGQRVDVSLMDSQFSMLSEVAASAMNTMSEDSWTPFRHPIHRTRDGRHVTINIGGARGWARLADALGHDDAEMPAVVPEANAQIGAWVAEFELSELQRRFEHSGAAYGAVLSLFEALDHPQFADRGMIRELPDRLDGSIRAVSSPLFFSEAQAEPRGPAPLAGEHSREILAELGYESGDVEALIEGPAVQESTAGSP